MFSPIGGRHQNVTLFYFCYTEKPVLSGHSKKDQKLVLRQIIAKCRSKRLQNAPREHSAILLTCTKLSPVFKTFVLSIFE